MTTPLIERNRATSARWDAAGTRSRRRPRPRQRVAPPADATTPAVTPATTPGFVPWEPWEACSGWYPRA